MKQIVESLKIYKPLLEAEPPKETGFYAFFVMTDNCFDKTELSHIKKGDCVYIGIAEDETLLERVAESHLKTTSRSTLRRSLGAILREKYDLKPIKRGITATKSNISNYTLTPESEQRLTDFMYQHLGVAFYSYGSLNNFEKIEKQLIKEFSFPVFNIEYSSNQNPYKRIIQVLRKECRIIVARGVNIEKAIINK